MILKVFELTLSWLWGKVSTYGGRRRLMPYDSKSAAIKLSQFRVTCLIFPSTLRNDVARHVSMTPKKCQRCIVIMGRRRHPAVGVPRGVRHFFGAPAKQGRLYAAPAKLCRSHPSHDFIIWYCWEIFPSMCFILFVIGRCLVPDVQCCSIENHQSPIYVVNCHFSRWPDRC